MVPALEQAHGAAGVLGTGCRARGVDRKIEHPDHSPPGVGKDATEKESRAEARSWERGTKQHRNFSESAG